MEDVVFVLEGEVHVVLAVFLSDIAVPKLTTCPRYILDIENFAMVNDFACHGIVCREDVVVLHLKVIAIVILCGAAVAVV
jgi:hypothetical protein